VDVVVDVDVDVDEDVAADLDGDTCDLDMAKPVSDFIIYCSASHRKRI